MNEEKIRGMQWKSSENETMRRMIRKRKQRKTEVEEKEEEERGA